MSEKSSVRPIVAVGMGSRGLRIGVWGVGGLMGEREMEGFGGGEVLSFFRRDRISRALIGWRAGGWFW